MPDTKVMSLTEIEDLAFRALRAAGTNEAAAQALAVRLSA